MHLPDGSPLPLVRMGAFPNETYVLGGLGMRLNKRCMHIILWIRGWGACDFLSHYVNWMVWCREHCGNVPTCQLSLLQHSSPTPYPRVNNCVGANNQKYFLLFTVSFISISILECTRAGALGNKPNEALLWVHKEHHRSSLHSRTDSYSHIWPLCWPSNSNAWEHCVDRVMSLSTRGMLVPAAPRALIQ